MWWLISAIPESHGSAADTASNRLEGEDQQLRLLFQSLLIDVWNSWSCTSILQDHHYAYRERRIRTTFPKTAPQPCFCGDTAALSAMKTAKPRCWQSNWVVLSNALLCHLPVLYHLPKRGQNNRLFCFQYLQCAFPGLLGSTAVKSFSAEIILFLPIVKCSLSDVIVPHRSSYRVACQHANHFFFFQLWLLPAVFPPRMSPSRCWKMSAYLYAWLHISHGNFLKAKAGLL